MLADEATESDYEGENDLLISAEKNKKKKQKIIFDIADDEDIDETEQEDEDTWNSLSTPQFKGLKDASGTTSTTPKSNEVGSTPAIIDPYFTHFDPRSEHQSYKVLTNDGLTNDRTPMTINDDWMIFQEAQQRLEETHREKVTRVMKDWSDLEEKYQDMRMADPKAAQSFKQRMTARFQVSKRFSLFLYRESVACS